MWRRHKPTKTVNKDLLTDKWWYYEGSQWHYFYSDGRYNDFGGTWQWFPTGDSMTINDPDLGTYNYYFDYITETEMAAGTRTSRVVYTTTP